MTYGEPAKLKQAINAIQQAILSLDQGTLIGLVTFDVTSEILVDPETSNREKIRDALERIVPRGVTCLAAGLTETINLITQKGFKGTALLLTDGRPNLSLNRMGGFEGSVALEDELLKIAGAALQKNLSIHTVAVGEDAFTHTLSVLSKSTGGCFWLVEDFQSLAVEPSPPAGEAKITELKVHGAPAELPSARPTWTKESQMMHVAVVSQNLYETYQTRHRAFLVNPKKSRETRTALLSIESEALTGYRERRAKITNAVRNEKAILVDRSYRDFLALDENAIVRLVIY